MRQAAASSSSARMLTSTSFEYENMKKSIFIGMAAVAVLTLAVAAVFLYERSKVAFIVDDEAAWDIRDASPQMKVIVMNDGSVARYVSEDGNSYTGEIQDTFTIPKTDAEVQTWYASDGKGVVYLKEEGSRPLFAAPDSSSETVGELMYESGYCPATCRCLGFQDGWFTIETDGATGYIEEKYVTWDAIDTF